MGNMATLPLAQLPKEDEDQFRKGFSPVAPLVYCALASLVYARVWARGFVVALHLAEGKTLEEAWDSDFPEKEYLPDGGANFQGASLHAAIWGGVIATEYMWECFLLILGPWRPGGWSIFPRWKRIHCMQHHLPFAGFVYLTIFLQWKIPNTFGSKEGSIVTWLLTLLNGNEFLETLQTTLTHPRVLSWFGWKNSDVLQKPHTLAPLENTRLLYTFLAVTGVLAAEVYALVMCLYHLSNNQSAAEIVGAFNALMIMPAILLHTKLWGLYVKRCKQLLRSGTIFRLSASETTFVREHVGTHVGHKIPHREHLKNKSK